MNRNAAVVLMLVSCGAAPVAYSQPSDPLVETRRIAEAGAHRLALDRAARFQPQAPAAAGWSKWEALRCTALARLGRHAQVLERLSAVPGHLDPQPLAPCFVAGARAAAALQRPGEAKRHAARALWTTRLTPADTLSLRRLVIDMLVAEQRGDEAFRAMLRYQQDHQPVPREVLGRFVLALLDLRMEKEALTWLPQLDEGQPAKLALRLRSGLLTREAAVAQARAALAKGGDAGHWQVILEASRDADALAVRISAYEHLLNTRNAAAGETQSAARRLWEAYLAVATDLANRANLLVGDDSNWADFAGRRLGTDPAVARALFAHLAQHGRLAASRYNAQLQLLHAYQSDKLEHAALHVFETVFGEVDALDTQVRYRVGALAEASDRPALAARYWRDLPPPPESDASEWQLRLARQAWRAGAESPGVEAIVRLLASQQRPTSAALAAGSAYAEELSEGGQARAAAVLMNALLPHVPAAQWRVLLVALGRAHERAGEWPAAAEAFLRAALLSPTAADAAASNARWRAGLALARAGYAGDARAQFEWVIANTKDATLIASAREELKRLH